MSSDQDQNHLHSKSKNTIKSVAPHDNQVHESFAGQRQGGGERNEGQDDGEQIRIGQVTLDDGDKKSRHRM